jgi:tetratricopeptide (TPR) repeat protein
MTGKPLGNALEHGDRVSSVDFGPDGTKLATGSVDGIGRIWDVATGKPLGDALQHGGEVFAVAFHPDGTKLATASRDRTAQIWDVATGTPLGDAIEHGERVRFVAFSADGTKLATASDDGTARIWDVTTGRQLGEFIQAGGQLTAVAFRPEGTKLATASKDGTTLWDIPRQLDESAAHLNLWVELMTGAELDDTGVLRSFSAELALRKREALERAGGSPRSWLKALERRRKLIRSSPQTEKSNPRYVTWSLMAKLRKIAVMDPTFLLRRRMDSSAKQSDWEKAAADLRRLIKLEPRNQWHWYVLSPILQHLGQQEEYRAHCRKMLQRFGDSQAPSVLEQVVKACSIAPDAVEDKERLGKIAQRAVKLAAVDAPGFAWIALSRGLADYRASNYRDSIKWLKQSLSAGPRIPYLEVSARLTLAMVHARLRDRELAQSELAAAKLVMDSSFRKPDAGQLGDAWHDLLICWILRAEAEKVVADLTREPAAKESSDKSQADVNK